MNNIWERVEWDIAWRNYKEIIFKNTNNSTLKEIIIFLGQDPYPNGANGIPFCKDNLKSIIHLSGGIILTRLGEKENLSTGIDGKELFFNLTKKGILFLNLSYKQLKENRKWKNIKTIEKQINDGFHQNIDIIKNIFKNNKDITIYLIILGNSKKLKRFFNKYKEINYSANLKFIQLIHPSPRNKKREDWKKTWQGNKNFIEIINKKSRE